MVSINLMLPITCTGVFVAWAVEFSVLDVAVPRVSFEAEACLQGQTLTPSKRQVAKAGQTAVSWTGTRRGGFVVCGW